MTDVVVTVPKGAWSRWLGEGDLAGDPAMYESHFWLAYGRLPAIEHGDRVYIVAHGKLRGYAPLLRVERSCRLAPSRSCLVRGGGARAVTIAEPVRGFQGWRYRWWSLSDERPFPGWMSP